MVLELPCTMRVTHCKKKATSWDSIILLSTIVGLWQKHAALLALWVVLYRQEIGYLFVTLGMNFPMLVSSPSHELKQRKRCDSFLSKIFSVLDLNGAVFPLICGNLVLIPSYCTV